LPPSPALALQPLLPLLDQANQALGRLDGLASILPDPSLFIYLYVRKEAVLSSQIEGTPLEIVENLAKLNLSKMAKGIFSAKKRKVELLEAELKAAGRECAYVFDAQERSER
jgi:Fic family protein